VSGSVARYKSQNQLKYCRVAKGVPEKDGKDDEMMGYQKECVKFEGGRQKLKTALKISR
jgi:hypothetical protein